ncbi:uncharacterized protein LOC131254317 [Magnolia sinica]|uniref:uncharacterized protein LOC131254317 n=1 Tax=Magnolia sinica TaxID=86752 RepID=UPI002658E5F5|nr:uncharacterized protein LOC131254317 [Magnolia sinica]
MEQIHEFIVFGHFFLHCSSMMGGFMSIVLPFYGFLLMVFNSSSLQMGSTVKWVKVQASLSALEDATEAGYEDFKALLEYLLDDQDKMSHEMSVGTDPLEKALIIPSERVFEKCKGPDPSCAQNPFKVLQFLNGHSGEERILHLYDEWGHTTVVPELTRHLDDPSG